jgi:ectoine hydroxylase-related dioxygenase (phytanoyl-CoA dioxygenase family)
MQHSAPLLPPHDAGGSEEVMALAAADPTATPLAAEVVHRIPVYDGAAVDAAATDPQRRGAMLAEWAGVFGQGAGVIVIRRGVADPAVIDRATAVFEAIIAAERQAGAGGGDHFARPGANDRIWNSLEKHCLADPANFAAYYAAHGIAMAAEAWLGPASQMTAQVNRVNPGGAAQVPHRDYHLGFMTPAQIARYPAHVHAMSPLLTLQGAVAHCDMPVETGPTMLLPFSHRVADGYASFAQPAWQAHFAAHHVQLPLEKGDLLFFNPAVMHGAGTNRTPDRFRMVNLLQISSAFGRAMETVDRGRMLRALYPVLLGLSGPGLANAVAAVAEGYPFPTNLDRNPPVGGLAPRSQADLVHEALAARLPLAALDEILAGLDARNRA